MLILILSNSSFTTFGPHNILVFESNVKMMDVTKGIYMLFD